MHFNFGYSFFLLSKLKLVLCHKLLILFLMISSITIVNLGSSSAQKFENLFSQNCYVVLNFYRWLFNSSSSFFFFGCTLLGSDIFKIISRYFISSLLNHLPFSLFKKDFYWNTAGIQYSISFSSIFRAKRKLTGWGAGFTYIQVIHCRGRSLGADLLQKLWEEKSSHKREEGWGKSTLHTDGPQNGPRQTTALSLKSLTHHWDELEKRKLIPFLKGNWNTQRALSLLIQVGIR